MLPVLDLDPMLLPTAAIWAIAMFRDQTLQPEFAGFPKQVRPGLATRRPHEWLSRLREVWDGPHTLARATGDGCLEEAVLSQQDTKKCEALLPRRHVQPMETNMQKTALSIFGALLISGTAVQMAGASEHHHVTKANYSQHHLADFRGAYNQVRPTNVSITPPAVYRTEESFRLPDPSWIGDQDPSLNPAD
jgi:hypothetical protein